MKHVQLSPAQSRVMWMSGAGGCFVHGAEVRTARSLERMGLGRLDDNGAMRSDDARWYFQSVRCCTRCGEPIKEAFQEGRCWNEQCEPPEMDEHDEAEPWVSLHGPRLAHKSPTR